MAKKVATKTSALKFDLFGNLLLLRRMEVSDLTPGGIALAPSARVDFFKSTVIAVGTGERIDGKFVPPPFSAGDVVLHQGQGQEARSLSPAGETLYLIGAGDVVARLLE